MLKKILSSFSRFKIIFICLCALVFLSGGQSSTELDILYLSYHSDPSRSIAICWHTLVEDRESKIYLRKAGEAQWLEKEGFFDEAGPYQVLIHKCEIEGLEPSSEYEFHLAGQKRVYTFRTLPLSLDNESVKYVIAGDAYRSYAAFHRGNRQIVRADPSFVVIGGDIAYTKGSRDSFRDHIWEIKQWHSFFSEWKNVMVGASGHMIPIVPVVGNHDVPRKTTDPKDHFVLLYKLFPFHLETISYGVLDVGNYLSLFLLDTGHTYPIAGDQTLWLKQALMQRKNTPFKMAAYHVSAYPSVYDFKSKTSVKIRDNWSPLFESEGVKLAFEHHNHAYKRTYPIKNLKKDPEGVVYIGDGCWGVSPRRPYKAWYLEERKKESCFNVVSLSKELCDVTVVSSRGSIIDHVQRQAAAPL